MSDATATKTAKVALITGANRGIGLETARQLGMLGIIVLVGARELKKGEAAAAELKKQGIDARAIKLDMVDAGDRKAAAEAIERDFGRLDILVNNAAINLDQGASLETSTTPAKTLRDTFDTNFFAVVELTQMLMPLIRKSAAGRIVNVSSGQGSLSLLAPKGSPIYATKTFSYDASKSALNSFTLHLAHELQGTQIKVNSIHPGWVRTDMGGPRAPLGLADGSKTSVRLATLPNDGPTGGYFHMGEALPW
jgi:NAD(P)-dependent dehydrogenase (short-subunit alcohol dehydrogenase family)